jgi:aspartyl-tRNA(Asn)/glutamyl-tRNA(Gln) amidotransferase subunit A
MSIDDIPTDFSMLAAYELAALMEQGHLTCTRLVTALLERIEWADPALGAFTEVFADDALRQAALRDGERARACFRGPLHGVPVVFKDLVDIAGYRTTAGSKLYGGYVAQQTASIVTRLELAGMVTLGKNHMVELAYGGWGTNAVVGTPWNPWDLECHRVPGGSSSGTAVAVAAGLAPIGIGSDTGGSVRIPAAMCGLVGLKTTRGQIPTDHLIPLSSTLDTVGPLTRCVTDAALAYTALSYASQGSKFQQPILDGKIGGRRMGILTDADLQGIDADVMQKYHDAIEQLKNLDVQTHEFRMGQHFEDLVARNGVFIGYEGWQSHGKRISQAPEVMDQGVLARFRDGENITATEYADAKNRREQDKQEMFELMAPVDFVLTPTTPMTAIPIDEVDESILPLNRFTRAVNYFGLCALAVPAGLGNDGLPVSIQFIGKPGLEAQLINAGFAYEQIRGPLPCADISRLLLPECTE